MKTSESFDIKDKKPDLKTDANAIASPDVFLTDRYRELTGNVAIRQVWAEGADRGYVIVDGTKIGYFELSEGMPQAEAEAELNGAYDGTAVVR